MKKLVTSVVIFASTSFAGVVAVSAADSPPNSEVAESALEAAGGLPATGASIFQGPFLYANVAILLGLGIVGSIAMRRRSTTN